MTVPVCECPCHRRPDERLADVIAKWSAGVIAKYARKPRRVA